MFQNISEKMTATMIENGSIKPEEAEFYRYGIGQSIFVILNLAVFLLIGGLCGMLRQTLLFYLLYAVLRKFTGGLHAKTPVACGILSDFLLLTVLAALKHFTVTNTVIYIVAAVSLLCILLCAPASHPNKKLDAKEIRLYGIIARAVALLEVLFSIYMLYIHRTDIASVCMFSLGFAAFFMVLGKIFQNETAVEEAQNEPSGTGTRIIQIKGGLQNDNSESC